MNNANTLDILRKGKIKRKIKENVGAWAFLAPYIIIFSVFFIVPFFYSIFISFHEWNMFQPSKTTFVGFDNYYNILFNSESILNEYFWEGLKNTLFFVLISVPVLIVFPLLLALLIDIEPPGYKIFRMFLFLPTVLSISAVILIWTWQLNTNGGFINSLLGILGFGEIDFLHTQPWAWISLLIVTVWWTSGTNMVILSAGLKNIDRTLYEAASIDGANFLQTFFKITIPSLAPQMFIVVVMTILASFNVYGQPMLLTNGGPEKSTTVLMMRIRQFTTGTNAKPGAASAMSLLLGIIMIIVSVTQSVVLKKRGDDSQ